jgi:hypothetical protein
MRATSANRLYFSKVANRVVAIGVLEHRSRKVRAPLGALPGNAWASPTLRRTDDGQCHRKHTADDCPERKRKAGGQG